MTQGISRKLLPDFFSAFAISGQGILWKLLLGQFHEYLPIKKYVFQKTGYDSEAFSDFFPISGNCFRKFFYAITRIFWYSNFIWNLRFRKTFSENPLRLKAWVMPQNRLNRFWKSFRKSSWVTSRIFRSSQLLTLISLSAKTGYNIEVFSLRNRDRNSITHSIFRMKLQYYISSKIRSLPWYHV